MAYRSYKEVILKADEYYDFAMYTYRLTKDTIIGPDMDVPFSIEVKDTYPIFGEFDGSSIRIYLMTLLNTAIGTDNELKNLLALSVIHELHHVTQNIDHHRYETDGYYARMIEESCEWMTLDYMIRFKDTLEEFLKISIDVELLKIIIKPILHTKYLKYKAIDASYWHNLINSPVARSVGEMFPEMEQIIENSTSCRLILMESETGRSTLDTLIKCNGEYICPDQRVLESISRIGIPGATVQCVHGITTDGKLDIFTIMYTLSDGENPSLYSPLIRLKYDKPCTD